MKCIILAAGYGTRLEKDLIADESGNFKHLIGIPKPLLPIAGQPLISHWINIFNKIPDVTYVNVVINALYENKFTMWLNNLGDNGSKINLVNDGSSNNESRPGAVACMDLGVGKNIQNTIFVAGDTLFMEDFNVNEVIRKFNYYEAKESTACMIISAPVLEENVSKHGVIEVSHTNRVTKFLEKPQLCDTTSRLQSPCFYIISKDSLHYLKDYLCAMVDEPLNCKDATGHFISYLINMAPVYAFHVKGRYDVGGLGSYINCNKDFK